MCTLHVSTPKVKFYFIHYVHFSMHNSYICYFMYKMEEKKKQPDSIIQNQVVSFLQVIYLNHEQ